MHDTLIERGREASPLTPPSTSDEAHTAADLSPRSSHSASSASSVETPIKQNVETSSDLSALQKLQYALERNSLFSNLFGGADENTSDEHQRRKLNDHLMSPHLSKTQTDDKVELNYGTVSTPASSPNDPDNPANIFECPLCSTVCSSRHSFNEHLVTHSQQQACPKCPFLTTCEETLRNHLQDVHDVSDLEPMGEDEEMRVPKVNSQGKVKTFKCKQCEYVAVTKMDFWSHTKSHIRQEKMLTCPKCPFVTEYKHHLEYHLRNHFGSKPFQCSKCSYTCVNKSMLNSHLKSHSNVYQYRCADCSYATKYCHSLKLHLRKYSHNPSMVLNPDGTPNPLPIIDVYGTRRGPKMKRSDPLKSPSTSEKSQYSPNDCLKSSNATEIGKALNGYSRSPQVSPSYSSPEALPEGNTTPRHHFKRFSDSSDSDTEAQIRHQEQTRRISLPDTPVSPKTRPQTIVNPAMATPIEHKALVDATSSAMPLELYASMWNQYLLNMHTNPLAQDLAAKFAKDQQAKLLSHILTQSQLMAMPASSPPVPMQMIPLVMNTSAHTPLDLRNPKAVDTNMSPIAEDLKKRKRKGKALKYDPRPIDNDVCSDMEDDTDQALDFSNNNTTLMCKYCEISFPDRVLYNMHMSYHSSDAQPFVCKSCGKRTSDKTDFFVHLTTDSHA